MTRIPILYIMSIENFIYKISCQADFLRDRLNFLIIKELSGDVPDDAPISPFDAFHFVELFRYSTEFTEDLQLRVEGLIGIHIEGDSYSEYSLREYLDRVSMDIANDEKGILFEEIPLLEGGVLYWPN